MSFSVAKEEIMKDPNFARLFLKASLEVFGEKEIVQNVSKFHEMEEDRHKISVKCGKDRFFECKEGVEKDGYRISPKCGKDNFVEYKKEAEEDSQKSRLIIIENLLLCNGSSSVDVLYNYLETSKTDEKHNPCVLFEIIREDYSKLSLGDYGIYFEKYQDKILRQGINEHGKMIIEFTRDVLDNKLEFKSMINIMSRDIIDICSKKYGKHTSFSTSMRYSVSEEFSGKQYYFYKYQKDNIVCISGALWKVSKLIGGKYSYNPELILISDVCTYLCYQNSIDHSGENSGKNDIKVLMFKFTE